MDMIIMDCGDTIKGECTIAEHIDKIELLSYSHGVAMQITGDPSNQKRTSGKPNHQDFTVTKYVDLATALLIEYCNKGTALPKVQIAIGQNEEGKMNQILTYDMVNAVVSSVSVGGGGGGKPQETVTFNYTRMTWTYKPQVPKGEIKGQNSTIWDLTTNTAT